MEIYDNTQSQRPKIRGTKGNQEKLQATAEKLERLRSVSRSTSNNGERSNRSDWRGRDPFGSVSGQVITQLIETTDTEIDETEKEIYRFTQKLEKLKQQRQELKHLQQLNDETVEIVESNNCELKAE